MASLKMVTNKVQCVNDRQGLNDHAMASLFKIMRLDYALSEQEELDR